MVRWRAVAGRFAGRDRLKLNDHVDAAGINTNRRLNNATASLVGDARDSFLSAALSTWNVSWTSGNLGFNDDAARLADAASARTEGSFSKWNLNLYRSRDHEGNPALAAA